MSEIVDWFVFGSWSALAAYQYGMTMKQLWARYKRWAKKREMNDLYRIIAGETLHGWRQVLEIRSSPRNQDHIVFSSVGNSDEQDDTTVNGSSVTILYEDPLLDGRKLISIHRWSLIRDASMPIMKLTYDSNEWTRKMQCFVNFRTVVIGFEGWTEMNEDVLQYQLVLLDVFSKVVKMFVIASPDPSVDSALFAFVDSVGDKRLHVIFLQSMPEAGVGYRYEFMDAVYDLPLAGESSQGTFQPRRWESISIPVGNRRLLFDTPCGDSSFVLFFGQDQYLSLSISFDGKNWRVQPLVDWLESFMTTSLGASIVEAARAAALIYRRPHPLELQTLARFLLPILHPIGGSALARLVRTSAPNQLHLLQRRLSLPSTKRLAAEALFKGNPKLKVENWIEEIGFDMLDGITEDTNADDLNVINL